MLNFLQNLNPIEVTAAIIGGVFVVLGMLGMGAKQRREESEGLADGLIKRLQLTVDQNAKDMTAMSSRIDEQQKEIHQLQGKNEAYLQIISLRDPAIAEVFKAAPDVFIVARETNNLVKAQAAALQSLTKAVEDFIHRLTEAVPTTTLAGVK